MSDEEKSGWPAPFLAGTIVVLLLIGGIYLLTEKTKTTTPVEKHLALSEADKPYVVRIEIADLQMSRAENMLGHELTYLVGELRNHGTKTIQEVEVTVEFKDMLGQVVFRDVRKPFGRYFEPIPGGQSRDFQMTFEGVPRDWNMQHPTIRISGLVLR